MAKFKLLTDEAIGSENGPEKDGLGFSIYASTLANAALGTPGPFTIGIFGEWGTGKTSLMQMIRNNIVAEKNVVTVWFNAWRYEREEHPIVPLITAIVNEMEKKRDWPKRLKSCAQSLIDALHAIAYASTWSASLKTPGAAALPETEAGVAFSAREALDKYAELSRPALEQGLYGKAYDLLSQVASEKLPIIVFIDDLDRCFPDTTIKLLESIKLVLSQPGFIFVLGISSNVVEGYLRHRYQTEFGIQNYDGRRYLDKIIQLPFHIPPIRNRMDALLQTIAERIDRKYLDNVQKAFDLIVTASEFNPRAAIRFVNNLLIDAEISKGGTSLHIPMEFFAITRCLQMRWPDVFTFLITDDALCKNIPEWNDQKIEQALASGNKEEQFLAAQLHNDKELHSLLHSEIGKEWCKNHKKRTEAVEFLFTQRGDLPSLPSTVVFIDNPRYREIVLPTMGEVEKHGIEAKVIRDFDFSQRAAQNPTARFGENPLFVFLVDKLSTLDFSSLKGVNTLFGLVGGVTPPDLSLSPVIDLNNLLPEKASTILARRIVLMMKHP